jgi:zeaxanthin epoxidase
MMPNLGQGGCQAIEDAYVLTEELCDITDREQIPAALQSYYRRRIVRSAIVQGMSRLSSDVIISAFSTPFALDEFLEQGVGYKYLSFASVATWYLRPFLPLIFYAQFGYLYSFTPSSFDGESIRKLVQASLERNKREVGRVYAALKEGTVTYFTAKTMSFMRFDKATGEHVKIGDAGDFRDISPVPAPTGVVVN